MKDANPQSLNVALCYSAKWCSNWSREAAGMGAVGGGRPLPCSPGKPAASRTGPGKRRFASKLSQAIGTPFHTA